MKEKRWHLLAQPSTQKEIQIIDSLCQELGIDEDLAILLWQRGVENFEQAKLFFRPSLDRLHDPFLMKDMDVALQRLEKALEVNEEIVVYGDYDVDGTTAVALVYGFLAKYHHNIHHYNPDRYKEGYGISKTGIDWGAKENRFDKNIN